MISKNNKGQKLLKKAKKIIPGGNQLFSKRSELFLPDYWPAYYSKAKGCEIWDLEKNKYFDFAGMGVTTCILGYADKDVNSAVKKAVNNANMGTLNSYEEVELAEELVDMHPWADQVRFARTGGEACAVAIRLSRAASQKDKILFCGYHGWQDWYLSANINSKSLDSQLLPGLKAKGIPSGLKDTTIPFEYNNLESFKQKIKKYDGQIGTIIMEPVRSVKPKKGFLEYIQKTAKKIGAVFIIDEITSGFRENLGGIHLKYNIKPDIAVLSKAMSNGYPCSAIIGKKNVMEVAQETFISSCMWTERIGFAASNATIKKFRKISLEKKLISHGKKIKKGWGDISKSTNIDINIAGIDPIPQFNFKHDHLEKSTFFNQEMLRRGFLTNSRLGTSYAYSDKIISKYLDRAFDVFSIISDYEKKNTKLPIKGPLRHETFKRLV